MSISQCPECGELFDTDFEMYTNKDLEPICEDCWEESLEEDKEILK